MHDRLKVFIWRVASGILPTKMNLLQNIGVGNSMCPLCLNAKESLDHLFFKCSTLELSGSDHIGQSDLTYSLCPLACASFVNTHIPPPSPFQKVQEGTCIQSTFLSNGF